MVVVTDRGDDGSQPDGAQVRRSAIPGFGKRRQKKVGGRTKRYDVTATPEEAERLGLAAAARGVSVPRLLVETTLRDRPTDGDDSGDWLAMSDQKVLALVSTLRRVLNVLAPVGNNLNQIARVANATGEVQPGVEAACTRVDDLGGRIREVVDEVEAARR